MRPAAASIGGVPLLPLSHPLCMVLDVGVPRDRTGVIGHVIDGRPVPRVTQIVSLARLQAPWETEPATAEELSRIYATRGPMGLHVHAVTAAYPGTVACPSEVCGGECGAYRAQFGRFVETYRPVFLRRETPVFSRSHGYAGTPDWIAVIGDRVLIGETKTGRAYPQVALQLAGYRYAEFTIDADGTETPVPQCSGGVVLSLFPDSYELRDVRCDDDVFQAFLSLRNFHDHKLALETAAVGSLYPVP